MKYFYTFLICLIGLTVSIFFTVDIYMYDHLYADGAAIIMTFVCLFLLIATIDFQYNQPYLLLVYRKIVKNFNAHKERLKKDLDE